MAPRTRRENDAMSSKETLLQNPTSTINWPPEPRTVQELETQWMPATRQALLKWLTEARSRAIQVSDAEKLKPFAQSMDEEWDNWAQQADIETGDLPNNARTSYDKVIKPKRRAYRNCHENLNTDRKHEEYQYAQAAWEDFLYYQNEWNRRGLVNEEEDGVKTYHETAAGAEAARERQSRETASKEKVEESMFSLHKVWCYYLIRRYTTFELGSRNSTSSNVGPDIAHRYSQAPRGTTPQKLASFSVRHKHLAQKFPGRHGRLRESGLQIDKQLPISNERGSTGSNWTVDEKSFAQMKEATDQSYRNDTRTKRLLPKDHILHHGVLESSFDWPTSFDAEEWGNVIAVTASKRRYVYAEEEDTSNAGQKRGRYKKDTDGHPVRLTEVCGYRKTKQTKTVAHFIHNLNEDGSVVGRDRKGVWSGEQRIVREDVLVNDPEANPVPNIRYRSKNDFRTVVVKSKWPRITRCQRHHQAGESKDGEAFVDQLSDDEASDCIKSNKNFSRSGNVRSGFGAADSALPLDEGASSDSESDDDGDPFTNSYLACSGPVCQRAQALLVRLRNTHGEANPKWTYHDFTALIDAEATDDETERIYREIVEAAELHEYSPKQLVTAARQLLAWEEEFGGAGWTVAFVAGLLSEETDMSEMSMRYRNQAEEATAQAVELYANLQERFGDADLTLREVAEALRAGQTDDMIKQRYEGRAQLLADIAKTQAVEIAASQEP